LTFEIPQDTLLFYAASVEKDSGHPLGDAILDAAKKTGITTGETSGFFATEGKGVQADVNGKTILIGNRLFLSESGIDYSGFDKRITEMENQGKTVILVADSEKLLGTIAIADPLKKSSQRAVSELKKMGCDVVMITGDNKRTAGSVASQTGITRVLAEVLPQDKAAEVKRLQSEGEIVAFVGDGINDAPALAQADVGIALGSGTDVAVESAQIVLVKNDPLDAVAAIQLGRKMIQRIKWNLFWAFAYNGALIPLAAGMLYPLWGISFRPELAGFAMAMSSVTVVTLSLLLKRYTPAALR
jgi:Cu+-exporting ATPase